MTARVWPVDAVAGAPSYSGRMLRQSSLAPLLAGASSTRPLGAASGVRPGTPTTTVAATSTTWTVHPLAGVADVETAAEAGPYAFAFDADTTGSVTAAHASLTRWDGIYVCIDDPAESDGSSTPAARIAYVAGNANATPANGEPGAGSGPAVPARSIHIARIVVPQSGGGSPSVVWLAPVCAAAGGIFINPPADQQTALNAIATTAGPVLIVDGSAIKVSLGSGFVNVASAAISFTNLSAQVNWGLDGTNPAQVSTPIVGKTVRVRGYITRPGATFTGVPGQVATVPAGSRPATDRAFAIATSNGPAVATVSASTGAVSVQTSMTWTQNVSWINLDTLEWETP